MSEDFEACPWFEYLDDTAESTQDTQIILSTATDELPLIVEEVTIAAPWICPACNGGVRGDLESCPNHGGNLLLTQHVPTEYTVMVNGLPVTYVISHYGDPRR